jgi:sulfhydrogenase subunit alpha
VSSTNNVNINVHHITRVEGHGNLVLDVKNGDIKKLSLDIVESPRLFEAMFRGRPYSEVYLLASRICGICSVAHSLASIKTVESAMNIGITEQTRLLRRVMMAGEYIESHILHLYFLAAPDFLNVGSVIPLVETHPDVVKRALKLKKLGNELVAKLTGRKVHSMGMAVKTFLHTPTKRVLKEALDYVKSHEDDLKKTVELIKTLELPNYEIETEYVASKKEDDYCLIGGKIASSKKPDKDLDPINYKDRLKEFCVQHSNSKHVHSDTDNPIQVGALARFNINHELLHPMAKSVAQDLGLKAPNYNPYAINLAQLVETVHVYEDAVISLEKLLDMDVKQEDITVDTQEGRGVGIVEAPRGLLVHDYSMNKKGYVVNANCIIPTGMNYANIEADLHHIVPKVLDKPQEEIKKILQMLVRAYDPCISCSVHQLNIEFVE